MIKYISICDNVLDPEDWPCHRLTIEDGVVIRQESVKFGLHPIPNMIGLTEDELDYQIRWLDESDRGRHPYCYPVLNDEPMEGSDIYDPWQIHTGKTSPTHPHAYITARLRNGIVVFSQSQFLNWANMHGDDVVRFYQLRKQ